LTSGQLNLDTTLDDVDPLGPERFAVRAVNRAVNKVDLPTERWNDFSSVFD